MSDTQLGDLPAEGATSPVEREQASQLLAGQSTARLFGVWRWILDQSSWSARWRIGVGAICAAMFAAGTASLSFIVTLDSKHNGVMHQLGLSRTTLITMLALLFLSRPMWLVSHVRCISAALDGVTARNRPVSINLLHRVLVVTTRDIPLLAMLAAALVVQNGILALLALTIVPVGPLIATFLIHRQVRSEQHIGDADELFIRKRNGLARSEALSDFPQTLIMTAMILWFTLHAQSLSHGPIAAVVINVMLASPPLRRLTKLASDVVARQKHDEDD